MALRKRLVKMYVFDGDAPIINAKVKFVLSEVIGYTTTHININRPIYAQTNGSGYCEKELWCEEDSLVVLNWNVYYPIEDNGEPNENHLKQFSLAYDDGMPIWIGVLQSLGHPEPDDTTLLYQAVEQMVDDTFFESSIVEKAGDSDTFPVVQSDVIVSGAGTEEVNGRYTYRGLDDGKPFYNKEGGLTDTSSSSIRFRSGSWIINSFFSDEIYNSGSVETDFPFEITEWFTAISGIEPAPGVAGSRSIKSVTREVLLGTIEDTANSASSTASSAQSTANSASSSASSALSTANTAATNASTALSTANTANTAATNANNNANAQKVFDFQSHGTGTFNNATTPKHKIWSVGSGSIVNITASGVPQGVVLIFTGVSGSKFRLLDAYPTINDSDGNSPDTFNPAKTYVEALCGTASGVLAVTKVSPSLNLWIVLFKRGTWTYSVNP